MTDRPVTEPDHEPPADQSQHRPERQDAPDGGWPGGLPYTVYFPDGDGLRAADLEHDAPLPRVGDTVEYVDEAGHEHRYRVTEVIHTLQTSAHDRPSVAEGTASPQSLAHPGEAGEAPGGNGTIRAGLPKVILASIPDE